MADQVSTALSVLRASMPRKPYSVPPEARALGLRLLAWCEENPEDVEYGHADRLVSALLLALDLGCVPLSPFIFEVYSACPESMRACRLVRS